MRSNTRLFLCGHSSRTREPTGTRDATGSITWLRAEMTSSRLVVFRYVYLRRRFFMFQFVSLLGRKRSNESMELQEPLSLISS